MDFLTSVGRVALYLVPGSVAGLWLFRWVAEGGWRLCLLSQIKSQGRGLIHEADFDEGRLKRAHRDGLVRTWDREIDQRYLWAVHPSDGCTQRLAPLRHLDDPSVPLWLLAFCRFKVTTLKRREVPPISPEAGTGGRH